MYGTYDVNQVRALSGPQRFIKDMFKMNTRSKVKELVRGYGKVTVISAVVVGLVGPGLFLVAGAVSPPQAATWPATNITSDSAQLHGDADANRSPAKAWFEWGEGTEDNPSYGNTTPKEDIGDRRETISVRHNISGLKPNTYYSFRMVVENDLGVDKGRPRQFVTKDDGPGPTGDKPSVDTRSATNITMSSAVLRCDVDPNGEDTKTWFRWGVAGQGDNNLTSKATVDGDLTSKRVVRRITGLEDGVTYSFRCIGSNSAGTDRSVFLQFTTDENGGGGERPEVTTRSATGINGDEARLRGEVDPNGLNTEVWFEWGKGFFSLDNDTNKQGVGNGQSIEDFDYVIDNLDDDEIYYFRAVARNNEGIDYGQTLSFRADDNGGNGPDILDVDIDDIDEDSARLICEVDPNGEDTDVWFEWDEDEDDVDDGRGEETNDTRIDGNENSQEVRRTITGLDEDTRYFFKCIAENRDGDDESSIHDFETDRNGGSSGDDDKHRAIAFKSPLILAGWGFDIYGKPVPNESPSSPGDTFLANHRRRMDMWKCGPLDARWDDDRKVWTAGGNLVRVGIVVADTDNEKCGEVKLKKETEDSSCDNILIFEIDEDPNNYVKCINICGSTLVADEQVRIDIVEGFKEPLMAPYEWFDCTQILAGEA